MSWLRGSRNGLFTLIMISWHCLLRSEKRKRPNLSRWRRIGKIGLKCSGSRRRRNGRRFRRSMKKSIRSTRRKNCVLVGTRMRNTSKNDSNFPKEKRSRNVLRNQMSSFSTITIGNYWNTSPNKPSFNRKCFCSNKWANFEKEQKKQ